MFEEPILYQDIFYFFPEMNYMARCLERYIKKIQSNQQVLKPMNWNNYVIELCKKMNNQQTTITE